MRALIDIPDDQIRALARIGKRESVSRAALIRRALTDFIAACAPPSDAEAFGSWSTGEDALAYEDRVRGEW